MAQTYTVNLDYQGQAYTFTAAEDQTVLEAAIAQGVNLPSSCLAGICTTCAALITEGTVEQGDAMGVGPDLREKGYALLCVSYPRSNLKVQPDKEDELYQLQFGQPK
jgi:ferredoxin